MGEKEQKKEAQEKVEHKHEVEYSQPAHDRLFTHNFDGIQEYDNPLPGWWKMIFYGTIIFSLGYYLYYHVTGLGASIYDEYKAEMAQLERLKKLRELKEKKVNLADLLKKAVKDPKQIEKGKKLFHNPAKGNCAGCHRADAGGLVGPNLTDEYWINGKPTLKRIYEIIYNGGRPGKGMTGWGKMGVLKRDEIVALVAYIYSLRGSKPKNPKPHLPEAKAYPEYLKK